jgi:Fe-S oxidoreductase
LLAELLQLGKLRLRGQHDGRIVFHDSCYLGRYNEVFREPREVLAAACGGTPPLEMTRCREESFCCGAGGGRMWMEEGVGKPIYLERTQEALRLNPSAIAVACPYCMIMLEDGLRDENATEKVYVKDVAEIVAEAMTGHEPHAAAAPRTP